MFCGKSQKFRFIDRTNHVTEHPCSKLLDSIYVTILPFQRVIEHGTPRSLRFLQFSCSAPFLRRFKFQVIANRSTSTVYGSLDKSFFFSFPINFLIRLRNDTSQECVFKVPFRVCTFPDICVKLTVNPRKFNKKTRVTLVHVRTCFTNAATIF